MSTPKITEGTATFKHPSLPSDKPCETWYKVIGDLNGQTRPLVTLHGGPGACHNYLLPSLSTLPEKYGIPVVFYDQIGNGKSTHYREKRLDTDFWTPELIMADLENLLEHLGIADDYDLLGQSWGGMMGAMWAIKGHKGLKRLIISDSPASMTLWVESCDSLRAKLPRDVDEILEKHEKDQTYDSQEYKDAVMFFYKRHLCRMETWPQDVVDSMDQLEKDDTVYMTMNGPSEFTVIGSLKTWSVVEECKAITVPTLLINGEHDEAQAVCVAPFFRGIPKCKWITVQGAGHMPNAEKPEEYAEIVMDFLRAIHDSQGSPSRPHSRLQGNLSPFASEDNNIDDLVKQIKLFDERERPNGTVKYTAFQNELRSKIAGLLRLTRASERDVKISELRADNSAPREEKAYEQSEMISKQVKKLYEHLLEG